MNPLPPALRALADWAERHVVHEVMGVRHYYGQTSVQLDSAAFVRLVPVAPWARQHTSTDIEYAEAVVDGIRISAVRQVAPAPVADEVTP